MPTTTRPIKKLRFDISWGATAPPQTTLKVGLRPPQKLSKIDPQVDPKVNQKVAKNVNENDPQVDQHFTKNDPPGPGRPKSQPTNNQKMVFQKCCQIILNLHK